MKTVIEKLFKKTDTLQVQQNQQNLDGFVNYSTKLGSKSSRTQNTFFVENTVLNQEILAGLYRSNGLARRIIDIPVDDAVRNFIECDGILLEEFNRLKTKIKLLEAGAFGRLFGGALLVAFIDDGLELDKPINYNKVQRIISLKVFDRHQVKWQQSDLSTDLYSDYFGEPEVFTIYNQKTNQTSDLGLTEFRIHRSRCFIFGGMKITNYKRISNSGWDDSVLQSVYDALRHHSIIVESCTEIVQDFIQIIFKIKDLGLKMSQKDGYADIEKRLSIFNMTRSVTGAGFIDADGEDYEKKASSVTGLYELWDRSSEFVSAVTGIPITKLFGRSPAGMNSTGDADLQIYYDSVRSYRTDQLEPAINWLINLIKAQKKWLTKANNYSWRFASLTSPSENEWADIKKKYAEIDSIYATLGAIDPAEAWQERYGDGTFHTNIQLSKPDANMLESSFGNEESLTVNQEPNQTKQDNEKYDVILNTIYEKVKK